MNVTTDKAKFQNHKVLMIAREFYPCQVVSSHRSGKFCKYLSQFGYDTIVITIDHYKTDWPVDDSLLDQIPLSTEIIRTFYPFRKSFKDFYTRFFQVLEKGRKLSPSRWGNTTDSRRSAGQELKRWIAVPDKDIFWAPWAIAAGLRTAKKADIIYATAPAFSVLVIAAILKRLTSLPLVIDLRDPWTLSLIKPFPTALHRKLDELLERRTFMAADAIICNTEAVRKRYQQLYPNILASRFTVITNGYDPEDFVNISQVPRSRNKVRIGYFGTIYAGRDPTPLFRAARRAVDEGLIPEKTLEFVFFGPSNDIITQLARQTNVSDMVLAYDFVPYADTLKQMAACDVLTIIGSPETDELHIPAKTYEYLALRKPILALNGRGALADLMKRYEFGLRVSPDDNTKVFKAIKQIYDDITADRGDKYLSSDCCNLSRRELTKQLATLFDKIRYGYTRF